MARAWSAQEFSQAVERVARRRTLTDDEARIGSALARDLVELVEALAAEAMDGLDRTPGIEAIVRRARARAKRAAREQGW